VKENVYLPDWNDGARVAYSDRLARILAALLPDGVDGSVSTVPGAFAPRARAPDERRAIAEHVVQHVATLVRLREETGKAVEIALEPEPSCMLETGHDTCRFFEEYVFSAQSVDRLSTIAGLSKSKAEAALRRHAGVCLDACHFAVEFEDAREAVERLRAAGIRVGKIQVTDALEARFTGDPANDEALYGALERFSDDVYLHQVVERRGGVLTRYLDLPDALRAGRASKPSGAREWRIHFHVPVFRERLEPFESTRPFLRDLFGVLREKPVTAHLEVETYTWDVLPSEFRMGSVDEAIAREIEFAMALASGEPPRENES
jgi:sugar phosphate isomerase/epimerase